MPKSEKYKISEKCKVLLILLSVSIFVLYGCNRNNQSSPNENPKSATYFVDSKNGNDENSGLSEDKAWRSLEKAGNMNFLPGDSICLKRGSEFAGTLYINSSGTRDNYITVTDYGDSGLPAPSFTNSVFDTEKNNFGNCIRLIGSYILVENMYCHHTVAELPSTVGGFTTMWELGAIYIDKTAKYCIVRNNEIFDCGVGIKSYGEYALIENNYIHDCNRLLKEWGWGPIGIWLGGDYQEVCYNRIFNYSVVDPRITWGANSYGGGADGGAIEIDDARVPKSNISIHHNYSRDCQGFIEVTWTDVDQNPPYSNFRIYQNVSDDYQQFVAMWRGADCRIENNTIIRRKRNVNDWGVFNITQNNSKTSIKNNIVVVENDIIIFNVGKKGTATPNNIIENNLYYAASGELIMGKEGPGESYIIVDPLLTNYAKGNEPSDFSITIGSPARDKGLNLGYEEDFAGIPIPQGEIPDIGAFEYKVD
ncbi:choice-of-anchor Q domain-containing protein [Dysgonomonas reticulitermitis]